MITTDPILRRRKVIWLGLQNDSIFRFQRSNESIIQDNNKCFDKSRNMDVMYTSEPTTKRRDHAGTRTIVWDKKLSLLDWYYTLRRSRMRTMPVRLNIRLYVGQGRWASDNDAIGHISCGVVPLCTCFSFAGWDWTPCESQYIRPVCLEKYIDDKFSYSHFCTQRQLILWRQ